MDELKEKILKRIDTLKDEAIELLADLVKADSVNPPGDTRKIMNVIVQKTQTFTQSYDTVAKEEVAPNILIMLNPGARPQLLYNGHLDTVPVGREGAWEMIRSRFLQ